MMVLEVEVDQALGLLPQIDQDKFLLEEHRKQYLLAIQQEHIGITCIQLILLYQRTFGIIMEEDIVLTLQTDGKKEVSCIVSKCYP